MLSSTSIGVVSLRALGLALSLAGDDKGAAVAYGLADLVASGQATDAHMQAVADKLRAGPLTAADWDDLAARISADRAALDAAADGQ